MLGEVRGGGSGGCILAAKMSGLTLRVSNAEGSFDGLLLRERSDSRKNMWM